MSQASAIQATIGGNISGQVAVGDHILQLGNANGGIVNIVLSSTQLVFTLRERSTAC
jgi:hypothetical protein